MDEQEAETTVYHALEMRAWYFHYISSHSVVIMRTDQTDFTDLVKLCFE